MEGSAYFSWLKLLPIEAVALPAEREAKCRNPRHRCLLLGLQRAAYPALLVLWVYPVLAVTSWCARVAVLGSGS